MLMSLFDSSWADQHFKNYLVDALLIRSRNGSAESNERKYAYLQFVRFLPCSLWPESIRTANKISEYDDK
jgi:hypothetical protein